MALRMNETGAEPGHGFNSSDDEDDRLEYDTSPLSMDWLDMVAYGCQAPLAVGALPGCRFKDTWRKLDTDIARLCESGVSDVFVLCTRGELHKYRVPWLLQELSAADLAVHHFPVLDGQTPQLATLMTLLQQIKDGLQQGRKTLVHCYGGLGRSGLVAVCLLLWLDEQLEIDAAIAKIRNLRGPGAIQSIKQFNFVNGFRDALQDFEEKSGGEELRSVSR